MSYGTSFGGWLESDWYDDREVIPCECGAVYPRHSRSVNASSINGIANGCVKCKKTQREREIAKAKSRCRLKLVRHIATSRKRTIYRDVACRYLERFGGSTFAVQTEADQSEIYLENEKGQILGSVSYQDKYPKPPETTDFSEMPF